DMATGSTVRASVGDDESQGNSDSSAPDISGNGRYVVFRSSASNLVTVDGNGTPDVFVRDLSLGTTVLASVATDGTQGNLHSFDPAISADGTTVAFASIATNLVTPATPSGHQHVFVHNMTTGATELASVSSSGTLANTDSFQPSISAD